MKTVSRKTEARLIKSRTKVVWIPTGAGRTQPEVEGTGQELVNNSGKDRGGQLEIGSNTIQIQNDLILSG